MPELQTGSDANLAAALKSQYESNADTNAFTDAEKTKLTGIATGATANTGALADKNTVATADIDNNAVTLAKMAQMASGLLLGRVATGTGNVETLTPATVNTLLGVLTAAMLASNTNGEGAALIGIEDAGAFTSQTNVEGALQEIYGTLDNHGDIVTQDQATFVKKTEQEVIVYDAGGDSNAARPTQASNKTVIWFNHGSSLPVNMGNFDIATGQGFGIASVNSQTGTAYTLVVGNEGFNVDMSNAGANTVTIPDEATEAFTVGAVIIVTQLGAGATTVSAATGVTLNGTLQGAVTIAAQYSAVVLRKTASNAWIAQGDYT